MSHPKQSITLSLPSEYVNLLHHLATEQRVPVDEVVADLLHQVLHLKKYGGMRVVQTDCKVPGAGFENEGFQEIVRRQDEEIAWLRDQIARLSTLTPTTHVIRHEYPAFAADILDQVRVPLAGESKNSPVSADIQAPQEPLLPPYVSVDDVHYNPPETGIEPEDMMAQEYSGSGREEEQTLRDFIGGVREEKEYTVSEAAAIAGETEAMLLEYIADGFLPAQRNGPVYRIRGIDLRRYMMSK